MSTTEKTFKDGKLYKVKVKEYNKGNICIHTYIVRCNCISGIKECLEDYSFKFVLGKHKGSRRSWLYKPNRRVHLHRYARGSIRIMPFTEPDAEYMNC